MKIKEIIRRGYIGIENDSRGGAVVNFEGRCDRIAQQIQEAFLAMGENGVLTDEAITKACQDDAIKLGEGNIWECIASGMQAVAKAQAAYSELRHKAEIEQAVKAEHDSMVKLAVDEGNEAYKTGVATERNRIKDLLKQWSNQPLYNEDFMKEF